VHPAAHHFVSPAGLALTVTVVGMGGWFARRLWQSHDDVKSLRQRLSNAQRARRRALMLAGFVGFALLTMWMHWWHINGG
jgi:hypothetical protein